jgi:hypothetical protein
VVQCFVVQYIKESTRLNVNRRGDCAVSLILRFALIDSCEQLQTWDSACGAWVTILVYLVDILLGFTFAARCVAESCLLSLVP